MLSRVLFVYGQCSENASCRYRCNGNEYALGIKLTYLCLSYFHILAIPVLLDALGECYQSRMDESVFCANCRPTEWKYTHVLVPYFFELHFTLCLIQILLQKALTHHQLCFSPSLQIPCKYWPFLKVHLCRRLSHPVFPSRNKPSQVIFHMLFLFALCL